MLDDAIKTQLKTYLERLDKPIVLRASLDDSEASGQLAELLDEIAAASPKVTVLKDGDSARRPSFTVAQTDHVPRVDFAGIPLGHEFTSLVLALLQVSGYAPKITEEQTQQIKAINQPLQFETYVSLSCHNCPDVVQALNTMSVLNADINSTMIDGALNQQEVDEKQIMSVPTVYLNGEVFGQGRMTLDEILAKLDTSSPGKEAKKLADKPLYDVLVVGGGPAGAAAAIYAARKGIKTGLVAQRMGGQVMDTMGIENYISVSKTQGPKLAADLEAHVKDYDVDIMNRQTAVSLNKQQHFELALENGAVLKAKTVILAPGARWREMNVPGEQDYRGKGVAYCPHCDGPLFKGKRVAVIGGGNSGVEAAIDLAGLATEVTLLEFDTKLRADAVLQDKLASLPNTRVLTNVQTSEVTGDGSRVNGLNYKDRATGEEHHIPLEGVFVQIGLLPNTDWLKGQIELTPRGEIVVNERCDTSLPGVFGAGDATTVPYKQIIIAAGEGAKAALSAFDYLIRSE